MTDYFPWMWFYNQGWAYMLLGLTRLSVFSPRRVLVACWRVLAKLGGEQRTGKASFLLTREFSPRVFCICINLLTVPTAGSYPSVPLAFVTTCCLLYLFRRHALRPFSQHLLMSPSWPFPWNTPLSHLFVPDNLLFSIDSMSKQLQFVFCDLSNNPHTLLNGCFTHIITMLFLFL